MIAQPRTPPPPIETIPTLLVVDDDPMNRELMRRLFEPDYQVYCAEGGKVALDMLARLPVDVVLLDIMMPDMNGFEVLRRIRETPETADLPVMIISALTESDTIVQGLQSGANDYLTKPINIHIARARLNTQVKLKHLLDERKRTIGQLERLHELREHFFRIASHDLKNPLCNLWLAHNELAYHVPTNEETGIIQDTIEQALGEMQELIEDFLDSAALQNGQLDLMLGFVNLKDCVWDTVAQYRRSASRKGINVSVLDIAGLVVADRHRLMQVIGNLISNAIKFSPPATTITIWSQGIGDRTRIFVADEGPGISFEEQARLFQEFSTGNTRPTGGETSTGLGLWIVNHLVGLMHGSVGVDAAEGGGSVFWIELPVYAAETARATAYAEVSV